MGGSLVTLLEASRPPRCILRPRSLSVTDLGMSLSIDYGVEIQIVHGVARYIDDWASLSGKEHAAPRCLFFNPCLSLFECRLSSLARPHHPRRYPCPCSGQPNLTLSTAFVSTCGGRHNSPFRCSISFPKSPTFRTCCSFSRKSLPHLTSV